MKKELIEQIKGEYPFVRIKDDYGYLTVSCGDGWYNLIKDFCHRVKGYSQQDSISVDDLLITTIKEKHGAMCIYYTTINSELLAYLGKLRAEYEEKSKKICEKCGSEGYLQKLNGSYFKTLCEDCAAVISKGVKLF